MTDYETIARQKLTLNDYVRMPVRHRTLEGFIFGISLILAIAGAYFFACFILSFG